jgi:hypothetical protein
MLGSYIWGNFIAGNITIAAEVFGIENCVTNLLIAYIMDQMNGQAKIIVFEVKK